MESSMLRSAALVGWCFGVLPDEALHCNRKVWQLRVAAAQVLRDEKLIVRVV